jgi:hypothetical protein
MARIPVYTEQTQAPAGVSLGNLRVPDMNLGATGQGLQQIGQAMGQVAQAGLKVEEERAKVKAGELYGESEVHWAKRLEELKLGAGEGAPDFVPKVAEDFKAWADQRLNSIDDPRARKLLAANLNSLRTSVMGKAVGFEAAEGLRYRYGQQTSNIQLLGQALYLDPSQENLQRQIANGNEGIDSANLNPEYKVKLKEFLVQHLAKSGAEAMAQNSPKLFLNEIEEARNNKTGKSGNAFLDLLPATEWDTYIRMANTALAQETAIIREDMNRHLQDVNAMAQNGIRDPNPRPKEDFVLAYGKNADRVFSSYQQSQKLASNIASMKAMPNEGIVNLIKSLEPKPGAGYAEALQQQKIAAQAAQSIITQRNDDPATFVASSSKKVNDAYKVFADTLNDPSSTPEQRRGAASMFAMTSIAEQERLGIRNPRLLSKQAVDQIQQQFFGSDDNELVSAKIKALSDVWGNNWPTVYRQLVDEKAIPDAAIVIGSGMVGAAARDMATAEKIGLPQLLKGLPSTTQTDVTDRVVSQLEPLRRTMIGSDGREMTIGATETFNTFLNSTVTLATYYHAQGLSVSDAAKKAADATVVSRYAFRDSFRIPVRDSNGSSTGLNPNVIENNAKYVLNNLKPEDLLIPESLRRDNFIPFDYMRNIKRRGYWINNENDDSLVLMNADTRAPVLYKNGKPVRFRYKDLMLIDENTPIFDMMAP